MNPWELLWMMLGWLSVILVTMCAAIFLTALVMSLFSRKRRKPRPPTPIYRSSAPPE